MRRRALLLLLLAAPTASAWAITLEAPEEAPAYVPFVVKACADAPDAAQLRVLAANASLLHVREDRYRDAFNASGCEEVVIRPEEGVVRIEARVRDAATERVRARAWANVTLLPPPRTDMRAQPQRVDQVEAFVFSVHPVVALVDGARGEVLVEAYTLTSLDVAAALARAADRGARVRVLLEGAPVGGVPAEERAIVAALQARGAQVHALGGEGARYRTVHAKLVVVDRAEVSVSTENLGEGGARGYGLIVRDRALAGRIADVIEVDLAGHDVAPFEPRAAPGELVGRPLERVAAIRAESVDATLVLSPDDPLAVARLVAAARASVSVEMLRAEPEGPFIDALLAAARNGSRVRVALDGRYDDGVNRETAARLNAVAFREHLDLQARLDRPERTLHAKAVVVDGRALYMGSMNWVRAAREENREAGLIVESAVLAQWLDKEMEKERENAGPPSGGEREVAAPQGIVLLLAITACLRRRRARLRQA